MTYIENPKTKNSGIFCAIPQTGPCPVKCKDCFFQSGRSYLEPLEKNLPNMPDPEFIKQVRGIVRFNDGNDSNVHRDIVIAAAKQYDDVYFNTSIPTHLDEFPGPICLTINPQEHTDVDFVKLDPVPVNLMCVRFRTNTWNLNLLDEAIQYYSARQVPMDITFMAYYLETIPTGHEQNYIYRKRTLNSYWVMTDEAVRNVSNKYRSNPYVYICSEKGYGCARCGHCLREYFVTKTRMQEANQICL